jgi:hypothetical protein
VLASSALHQKAGSLEDVMCAQPPHKLWFGQLQLSLVKKKGGALDVLYEC